jgi:hypothetical protein
MWYFALSQSSTWNEFVKFGSTLYLKVGYHGCLVFFLISTTEILVRIWLLAARILRPNFLPFHNHHFVDHKPHMHTCNCRNNRLKRHVVVEWLTIYFVFLRSQVQISSRRTVRLTELFVVFLSLSKQMLRFYLKLRPRPLPSTSLPIHHSLVIPSLDSIAPNSMKSVAKQLKTNRLNYALCTLDYLGADYSVFRLSVYDYFFNSPSIWVINLRTIIAYTIFFGFIEPGTSLCERARGVCEKCTFLTLCLAKEAVGA